MLTDFAVGRFDEGADYLVGPEKALRRRAKEGGRRSHLRRLAAAAAMKALKASPKEPLRKFLAMRQSDLMCPIRGSMATRREFCRCAYVSVKAGVL